jgi:hypothetical protein
MRSTLPTLLCLALAAGACTPSTRAPSPDQPAPEPRLEQGAPAEAAPRPRDEGAPREARRPVAALAPRAGGEGASPVVIELFSSEGCSSCPPADAVLRKLAAGPAIEGAPVIALELHVDYWNQLGWIDPFSRAAFSERQRAYASAFRQRGVYTPQAVVDGQSEVVGSREEDLRRLIAGAASTAKARVSLALREDRLQITVRDLPEEGAAEPTELWLAITEEGLSTAVPSGENAGATLAHGPIVRSLALVGTIAGGARNAPFSEESALPPEGRTRARGLRAVAFVQRSDSRRIVGAGVMALR